MISEKINPNNIIIKKPLLWVNVASEMDSIKKNAIMMMAMTASF